jgi:hypothetical protein
MDPYSESDEKPWILYRNQLVLRWNLHKRHDAVAGTEPAENALGIHACTLKYQDTSTRRVIPSIKYVTEHFEGSNFCPFQQNADIASERVVQCTKQIKMPPQSHDKQTQ